MRRALVVRLGAMGDILHALPAVAALRQAQPNVQLSWVIEERWRELLCAPDAALSGSRSLARPLVDEVVLVNTRRWRKNLLSSETREEFVAALSKLRDRKFDIALDLQGAIKSAVLAKLSGAKAIVGFATPREGIARLLYSRRVPSSSAHVIDQNRELVSSVVSGTSEVIGDLLPHHADSEQKIEAFLQGEGLRHFAILNPGAGWGAKQWPAQRFGQLAVALRELGIQSVINYGPGEERLAEEALDASEGTATEFRGTISELIAVTRRASLFVGGDTGPMHLAAVVGVPTVALFGPTDPARNGPYYPSTCALRDPASVTSYSHTRTEDEGLKRITVQDVLAASERVMREGAASC